MRRHIWLKNGVHLTLARANTLAVDIKARSGCVGAVHVFPAPVMLFDGTAVTQRRAAMGVAKSLIEEAERATSEQQRVQRVYERTREHFVVSNCRLFVCVIVGVIGFVITLLWFVTCMRKEIRLHTAAMDRVNRTSVKDLLDADVSRQVRAALDLLEEDVLANAIGRMVTDLPVLRMLGAYEEVFYAAWADAMKQHMFVGFLCTLFAVSVLGSIALLCALVYKLCTRPAAQINKH